MSTRADTTAPGAGSTANGPGVRLAGAVKLILATVRLIAGLPGFAVTKRTRRGAYLAMRQLHVATRGASTRALARVLARPAGMSGGSASGVLGTVSGEDAQQVAGLLGKDGFYVFDVRLEPRLCDDLVELATTTRARLTPAPADGLSRVYDPRSPLATRYDLSERDLLSSTAVRQILTDPTLRLVAGAYLGSTPVNDLVAMWWTVPHGEVSAAAAQMFHYDLDRVRFLKFFVYLTDVSTTTGPHVYVRGSHRDTRPDPFYEDRRFTDEEVAAAYGPDDIVSLDGPKGTILAVDTAGLHKGEHPIDGDRLVFQMEFAASLFGAAYERVVVDEIAPRWSAELAAQPRTYQRFLSRS